MPKKLTEVEQGVYQYLIDFLYEHTYQPSVREIGKHFGIKSTKTVSQLLHSIAAKGYIELDPSRSRGVRLLGFASARTLQPVPVYDTVAREAPELRPEHRGRFVTLDRCFVPAADVFFVRAADDAMAPRGILAGDLVLVRPGVPEADGALVAARAGDRAVVRALIARGGVNALVPAAGGVPEMPVRDSGDGVLLGEVCGVMRPPRDAGH
ncbi:MAG TPA: S24 family peptidase [Gemmatimonadaceae bacterium]|nr:S24 family peptidase [Gemmatimonadaceae bacterium]